MRPRREYEQAMDLIEKSLSDCEISRLTGIPRPTARDWRRGCSKRPRFDPGELCPRCGHLRHDLKALPARSYAHLLGMYLGDGAISEHPRTYALRIAPDMGWPAIIAECDSAMRDVFPSNRVSRCQPDPCAQYLHSRQLVCLFPQHGLAQSIFGELGSSAGSGTS
jgi:hypothetical protein